MYFHENNLTSKRISRIRKLNFISVIDNIVPDKLWSTKRLWVQKNRHGNWFKDIEWDINYKKNPFLEKYTSLHKHWATLASADSCNWATLHFSCKYM